MTREKSIISVTLSNALKMSNKLVYNELIRRYHAQELIELPCSLLTLVVMMISEVGWIPITQRILGIRMERKVSFYWAKKVACKIHV